MKKQQTSEWVAAQATIIACKQTFLSSFSAPPKDGGIDTPTYAVRFCYHVQGRQLEGKYRAGSPREIGHGFEILYDPDRPERNTGNQFSNPWIRVIAWVLGAGFAAIAIWLTRGQEWMSF